MEPVKRPPIYIIAGDNLRFIFFCLSEQGKFLALDLGGTHFRVLFVRLGPGNHFHQESEIYELPMSIQTGKGQEVMIHNI